MSVVCSEARVDVIIRRIIVKPALGLVLCVMALAGGCERSEPATQRVSTTVAQAGGPAAIQARILELERNREAAEQSKGVSPQMPSGSNGPAVGVLPSTTSSGVAPAGAGLGDLTLLVNTKIALGSKGRLSLDGVLGFASEANPVPGWVEEATGGAPNPESDAELVKDAFLALGQERMGLRSVGNKLRERNRQLLDAEPGQGPATSAYAHRFKSQRLLGAALDGAIIRFDRRKHLGDPSHGDKDKATSFGDMGLLLATEGTDALLRGKHSEARTWYARQARFGSMVTRWACTLEELSAGVNVAQEGLSLLAMATRRLPQLNSLSDPKDIDIARHALGLYRSSLQRVRRFFKHKEQYADWLQVAKRVKGSLWRYEAVHALAAALLVDPQHARDDAIEIALRNLAVAANSAQELSVIAKAQLEWLDGLRR